MADADVRAEARELLNALNTDSSRVNPATGTSESFNKDTADNTKTLTEQVDEILGNLPKKKTAKEKRDDIVEEAEVQAQATAKTLVSSLNPAVGALSKIANSILGVTRSVLGAGLKAGGLALGFRSAMAAFDEFMQPDQSMKERLIGAITGFLARTTTDILNFVGADVDYEEMKKEIKAFFDRTVKFLETLPADVEEKFEKFKVDFKNAFDYAKDEVVPYIIDVALPSLYDAAVEVAALSKKIYEFTRVSGQDYRDMEQKTLLERLIDDIKNFGLGIADAFSNLIDDFSLSGLTIKTLVQSAAAFVFDKLGMDERAAAVRSDMVTLEEINTASRVRREQREELRKLRIEQEEEKRIFNARSKALERYQSMRSESSKQRFLSELGMTEEMLFKSFDDLLESTTQRSVQIMNLEGNIARPIRDLAQTFTASLLPKPPAGLGIKSDNAIISILDPSGNYRTLEIPFSQVTPESMRQYQYTGIKDFTLLDQFGDIDPRREAELVPLITRILERNPELFAAGEEKLANALKQAIEDANLQGSVLIDNSTNDNSQKFESSQTNPGNADPTIPGGIGPVNEPALVIPG